MLCHSKQNTDTHTDKHTHTDTQAHTPFKEIDKEGSLHSPYPTTNKEEESIGIFITSLEAEMIDNDGIQSQSYLRQDRLADPSLFFNTDIQ